ncbi:MAG: beta-ketoacyl-[acyl-carrier-protein] synthase family protein [Deltaproteobacteria bacterium]|nr:beta-ketoacyl-[acyl-carrier-protein] synthase family protein [Deltaproteobacteria bacterium]
MVNSPATTDVAITGMGVISAAGTNLAETLASLRNGERNAAPVTLFDTALRNPVFEVRSDLPSSRQLGMRSVDLALMATEEALKHARLQDKLAESRTGVCFGTTVASQLNDTDFYREFRARGSAPQEAINRFLRCNVAEAVSRAVGASGPCCTVTNACTSGADAIGVALSWLRNGVCDVAIAGGADELNHIPLCGFASLGILSESLCAPFDEKRDGLNLGEGAGVLVLERTTSAQRRGLDPTLFLRGYGAAADAFHLTAPRPNGSGLESALRWALAEAGLAAEEVSFVNAHGTSTRDNDSIEATVLARVLGDDISFLSTKGYTGHTLGAAGAIEVVFSAAALREKWVPASAGFSEKGDDVCIAPVTETTPLDGSHAVSTSLGFGGNNAALVISTGEGLRDGMPGQ